MIPIVRVRELCYYDYRYEVRVLQCSREILKMILQYTLTDYMPAESYIDAHVNIGYVIDQVGR